MLNEDELSTILSLIQNHENRERFFNQVGSEKQKTSSTTQNVYEQHQKDGQMETDLDGEDPSEVVIDEIDQKKWMEFLGEISKRMAESFLRD